MVETYEYSSFQISSSNSNLPITHMKDKSIHQLNLH